MNEYGDVAPRKDDIRSPGKVLPVQPKPQTDSVHGTTYRDLGPGVLRPDPGHLPVLIDRWRDAYWNIDLANHNPDGNILFLFC